MFMLGAVIRSHQGVMVLALHASLTLTFHTVSAADLSLRATHRQICTQRPMHYAKGDMERCTRRCCFSAASICTGPTALSRLLTTLPARGPYYSTPGAVLSSVFCSMWGKNLPLSEMTTRFSPCLPSMMLRLANMSIALMIPSPSSSFITALMASP